MRGVKLITKNEEQIYENVLAGLRISIVHAIEVWIWTNSVSPVDNQRLLT